MAVLRTELETTTAAIGAALEQWQPVLAPSDKIIYEDLDENNVNGKGEQGRIQSILNNALAYRHSAFVYLYRVIREYPRSHPLVQYHTHLSLTHCVGTVSHEGPMSALLWPLFVAACEATSAADRSLARQAFVAIDKRQGMINIERAWCIVREVWRRADDIEIEGTTMLHHPRQSDIVVGPGCDASEEVVMVSADEGGADSTTVGSSGVAAKRRQSFVLARHGRCSGGDLWRRVSQDMGMTIVFG